MDERAADGRLGQLARPEHAARIGSDYPRSEVTLRTPADRPDAR